MVAWDISSRIVRDTNTIRRATVVLKSVKGLARFIKYMLIRTAHIPKNETDMVNTSPLGHVRHQMLKELLMICLAEKGRKTHEQRSCTK